MSPEAVKARGLLVVIGAAGQLGFDLVRTCTLPGQVVPLTRADIDVLDADKARRILADLRPTHILNTAAWNEVDRAEDEREPVFALNARAPGDLAAIAHDLGAVFAHFSTDYVFDGRRTLPYAEDDTPNPISVYAESKLAGERLARARCERTFVFRVCGLFGVSQGTGKSNFVRTMVRLARAGRPIRVVSDQVLTPSSTLDLAAKVWAVLATGAPDLYHVTNAGQTSWYDFAREVFRLSGLAPDLQPVTAAEYGARARRPAYSVLAHTRLAALGLDDLRSWRDALASYMAALARADEAVSPSPSA
jgi:dTDP-4-dehydrorhamnose reductase